jgi:hypothetical protein
MPGRMVHGLAIDPATGRPRRAPLPETELARLIERSLTEQCQGLADVAGRIGRHNLVVRGERRRRRSPDLGDPRTVGWTFAVHAGRSPSTFSRRWAP